MRLFYICPQYKNTKADAECGGYAVFYVFTLPLGAHVMESFLSFVSRCKQLAHQRHELIISVKFVIELFTE